MGCAAAKADLKPMAAKQTLDAEIDRQLALNDPQFREYLQKRQAASEECDPAKRWMPLAAQQHLDQKRASLSDDTRGP
jgi:hypothetical protein